MTQIAPWRQLLTDFHTARVFRIFQILNMKSLIAVIVIFSTELLAQTSDSARIFEINAFPNEQSAIHNPYSVRDNPDNDEEYVADIYCPKHEYQCKVHQTCCKLAIGGWGCCPYKHAICCSDGVYCCPSRSKCNLEKGTCIPDPQNWSKVFLVRSLTPTRGTYVRIFASSILSKCRPKPKTQLQKIVNWSYILRDIIKIRPPFWAE